MNSGRSGRRAAGSFQETVEVIMSKILIIEDEVAIADLEKDYLELSGFEVKIENRGDKGLQTALREARAFRLPSGRILT